MKEEHGLHSDGEHLYFNHHDITESAHEMLGEYVHGEWEHMGWHYG